MKFFICFLFVVVVHAHDSCVIVCELKAETGRCRGSIPRYHFNKTTGQCEEFTYGGCGGNENNFETIEECQKTCDPVAHGPCKNPHEHYATCETSCPVTCANYNDTKPQICSKDFYGCLCDEGFYREYARFVGRCVAKEDCPVQGETIYVGTVEEPSLASSEYISHISYFEDSIVRSSSPKIAPPPSPGNAPIPKAPSPPTYGSTDFNKPAPVAPNNPPKKSKEACNEEPSTCALTKPVSYGYYYYKEANKCQRFPFANCKGSGNNFSTEEECKNLCIG